MSMSMWRKVSITYILLLLRPTSITGLCSDCWCVPDYGPNGECPPTEDRIFPSSPLDTATAMDAIKKFRSFNLDLTPFDELSRLVPMGGVVPSETVMGAICNPFDTTENVFLPRCDIPSDVLMATEESVCGFFFDEDPDSTCSDRSYGMKTYSSIQEANDNNAFVTHLGPCGVCSNAKDLAALMTPGMATLRKQCNTLANVSVESMYHCYQLLGHSPDCAWLNMSFMTAAKANCKETCVANYGEPANDLFTCAISDCAKCPLETNGRLYKTLAGRISANSGIVGGELILPCADIPNIKQDPCAA